MARRRRGQFPEPKKENGLWKIRYYTDQAQPDGTRRRVRKTKCLGRVDQVTYREAKKEAQRFLQPINDVEPGIEHAEKTVNELIQQWRTAVKPNLKRSTQESYEWAFKRVQTRLGRLPVVEVNRADIQRLLTDASRELAPESVHDLRNRMSGLFTAAEDWNWIPSGSNPVRGRLRLPERLATRKKYVLSPEQAQNLILCLYPPYNTIVMLAVLSGLRRGEISALRWNDISETHLTVDEAVYLGELGSPKSRKSRRRVAIGLGLSAALKQWRDQAPFTGHDDFVFGIRTNTPIDLHNVIARHVKPVCQRLGLPPVSWHDFRHTYTTWGRRAGVNAEAMRDQLGHSSVKITLDVYSHVDDREADAAKIERLGGLNGTPNGTLTGSEEGLTC